MDRQTFRKFDAIGRRLGRSSSHQPQQPRLPGLAFFSKMGGRSYVSEGGCVQKSIYQMLDNLADARKRRNWHDFLTYRERVRAMREKRREVYIPYFSGRPA